MQVTRYQLLSMLSDSHLESAQLHLDLAKVYEKERVALSLEAAAELITVDESLIPESLRSQVKEAHV